MVEDIAMQYLIHTQLIEVSRDQCIIRSSYDCYTQILSPTCDEILNTYVFPNSQTWSGKHALDICQFYMKKPSTTLSL